VLGIEQSRQKSYLTLWDMQERKHKQNNFIYIELWKIIAGYFGSAELDFQIKFQLNVFYVIGIGMFSFFIWHV
jgi:hypothetical protein